MKNALILSALLTLGPVCFAQQTEKYPLGNYEELTDTKPHDGMEVWNKMTTPTQLSWGTTDIRYKKLNVPDVKKTTRWQGKAWKGERINAQAVLWTKEALDDATITVSELKSGSAWYVPGGRSTIGRLFNDACGRYVFSEDKHSGSIPLAFETVFDKAGDADVWTIKYNRDRDMTYADLKADYTGYTGFKAFKTRNIYGCNTAKVPFYEETPFRPDYLLADLIQILHPEIGDLGGLRYFCKLNE